MVSLSTPIMNGLRTNYKKFISCNVIDLGDSVESLSIALDRFLRMTASKAGIGFNSSRIRGIDADIGGRMKHTGVLPLLKAYESATTALSQISRNGCFFKDSKVKKLSKFFVDNVEYEATEENLKKFNLI